MTSTAYDKIVAYGKREFGIKIAYKNESLLMRILGYALFFNPAFMTRFITVIGTTVYFPSRKWLTTRRYSAAHILCHELVHVADERRVGALAFRLSYLFPQWLALFALSSFFIGPIGLLFLIFLAPLPAPFRTFWELRGYAMTDAALWQSNQRFTDLDRLTKQFTSGAYYFMWPFRNHIMSEVNSNRKLIQKNALFEKIPESSEILENLSNKDNK